MPVPDSFGRSGKECAVARSNGKYWSRVESYALEDQLLTVKRVLLVGAGMTEKYSLSLYVSVFHSVVPDFDNASPYSSVS